MGISCWNPKWVLPFESVWSIIEKYKAANRISSADFLSTYALDLYKKRHGTVSKSYRELYTFKALNQEKFSSVIGTLVLDYQSRTIDEILSRMPSGTNIMYFRDYLAYCPICIEKGFHSIFHQFSLLHHCPFHQLSLLKVCSDCGEKIPYILNTSNTVRQNKCVCTINYSSDFNSWANYISITCPKVARLLNLDNSKMTKVKTMLLMLKFDPEPVEFLLDVILNWVDSVPIMHTGVTHTMSSPKILQKRDILFDNEIEDLTPKNSSATPEIILLEKKQLALSNYFNQEIKSVISSAAKHFRKKFLKKHRSCIGRIRFLSQYLGIQRDFCPIALAYLYWRKHIDNLTDITDIDRLSQPQAKYFEQFIFSQVNTAYLKWIKLNKDYTKVNPVGISWLIRQVVWTELVRLFNECMIIAIDNVKGKPRGYKSLELDVTNMICVIPEVEGEPFEFITWNIEDNIPNPICPNDSVKKRRYTLKEKKMQDRLRYNYYFGVQRG